MMMIKFDRELVLYVVFGISADGSAFHRAIVACSSPWPVGGIYIPLPIICKDTKKS